MGKKYIQRIHSKWTKAKMLMNDRTLTNYHPKTKTLNKDSLHSMLKQYNMVFIKPVYGMHGNGVMRLTRLKNSKYQIQSGFSKKQHSNFSGFYHSIKSRIKKKPYMVQKGIHLLKYNRSPFDIRVMVQKNSHNHWEVSGMLCRVAHPQKVVTNVYGGGKVMPLNSLLAPYASKQKREQLAKKLRSIGMTTALHFQRRYPGIKELGMDVGVDSQLKPWIIEVNTMPDLWLFCKLRDRTMFRRIIRNAKAYGRVK